MQATSQKRRGVSEGEGKSLRDGKSEKKDKTGCGFPIGCLLSLLFSRVLLSLTSAFVVVGRIAPDEERIVLLKPVVQFYFTNGVLRGFLDLYYTACLFVL